MSIRMMRTVIVGSTLALAIAACDRAADEQQKANNAQAEANRKIAESQKESQTEITNAQVEANKKIAEAQANFLKMREDYRHKVTTDLVEVDRKLTDLDNKAVKATGKAKSDLTAKLPDLRARREALAKDYQSLESATVNTWDSAKARMDKELSELKDAMDRM